MKMPSTGASQHNFAQVPKAEIERSQFDRSHGYKTTFDAGWLIPIFVDEALPGDTFNLRMNGFARLATPIKPLMDNMYLETFFFAIPNRLVWDNWQKFCGEQTNPGDSIDYVVPQIVAGVSANWQPSSIFDYMGLPVHVQNNNSYNFSALPLRAANLVYNEWFRDENLQPSLSVPTGDGPDDGLLYNLFRRGKRHDYFTSCLPLPQKGEPVGLPAVYVFANTVGGVNTGPTFRNNTGTVTNKNLEAVTAAATSAAAFSGGTGSWGAGQDALWDNPNLYADMGSLTINDLRQAFQIQRLLERDARGGTRYTEILKSHFGVTSPDARLQRPEYLGGGHTSVNISPVAQTSIAVGETPQGNLAGVGTASWSGHGFAKSFTEHSIILGFACVRADMSYQQGLDRSWSRRTRYDFYWPALSHIGEQAVLNQEILMAGVPAQDEAVFGYQERYAEYRYKPSLITGKFRSLDPQTLDIWHLAQEFDPLLPPALNASFIVENPPVARVIAVQDEPHFLLDAFFNLKCARPMPVFGVPGMIDHF